MSVSKHQLECCAIGIKTGNEKTPFKMADSAIQLALKQHCQFGLYPRLGYSSSRLWVCGTSALARSKRLRVKSIACL
jgi:hypothetical protein